jgi:hypothetical protein
MVCQEFHHSIALRSATQPTALQTSLNSFHARLDYIQHWPLSDLNHGLQRRAFCPEGYCTLC